ncbi:hypothetical protein [Flavobacterium sediminis]|nr:hypothetical protein [Flavobacterium sediminis]
MFTILIIITLVIIYFIIAGIKENETREAVDRERRISNKKIADIHFQNMVQNALNRQKLLNEVHNNFIIELENEDYIKKARIEDEILKIQLNCYVDDYYDAQIFAENLLNSLNYTTGINQINVFDCDGFAVATTSR